jgi:hypothetical protein
MNESHEVTLHQLSASFMEVPFDLVLGLELQSSLKVDECSLLHAFTDLEWQVIYCRVLVEDRWHFLPQDLYDEIDEVYGERIGDELWKLSCKV